MNMKDNFNDLREYIILAQSLTESTMMNETVIEEAEEMSAAPSSTHILHELNDLVVRLRTFMESETGDYALGVEMGMQRAADMVENLIRRHSED